MLYIPIGLLFFLAFWLLFGAVALLLQIGILRYVFERMGVSRRYMLALLLFSLLGSYVNIPIWRMPGEPMRAGQIVDFYGVPYVVPVLVRSPGTILAVNLGGAIIPLVLSIQRASAEVWPASPRPAQGRNAPVRPCCAAAAC